MSYFGCSTVEVHKRNWVEELGIGGGKRDDKDDDDGDDIHKGGRKRINFVQELWVRNLDHILERVLWDLDPLSRSQCREVSRDWARILDEVIESRRASQIRVSSLPVTDVISRLVTEQKWIILGFQNGWVRVFEVFILSKIY